MKEGLQIVSENLDKKAETLSETTPIADKNINEGTSERINVEAVRTLMMQDYNYIEAKADLQNNCRNLDLSKHFYPWG